MICAALVISTGCSREQSADSKPQPAALNTEGRSAPERSSGTTSADDRRPPIVTFGDSLTAGVVENTYPEYLQELLNRNGYVYRVENQGVSGDTTSDGLARIENVVSAHPALVVLEFGGNDGLRGLPVEQTKQNMEAMIIHLQRANIPVALAGITLPPNYGPDYVKSFTAIYPELAKKYRLRFVPFLLLNVYQHPEMMQPDGIHPSGEGNKIVARDVFELVKPMLKPGGNAPVHG